MPSAGASVTSFIGATALGILAFKGFITITNSGSELKDPRRNLGKAILISIALCVVIYALVGFAVSGDGTGREAGAIPYIEGDDLHAALIATIEELLHEDAADVLQHECITIA
jgi:amino acid transporter